MKKTYFIIGLIWVNYLVSYYLGVTSVIYFKPYFYIIGTVLTAIVVGIVIFILLKDKWLWLELNYLMANKKLVSIARGIEKQKEQ